MVDQDLAYFFVEPVLDRQLFEHPQADAVGHGSGRLGFDVPAFDQAFHNFSGHVRYIVPEEKHLSAFPLRECRRVSLLAAPRKCKEAREIARKSSIAGAQLYHGRNCRNVRYASAIHATWEGDPKTRTGRFECALSVDL